MDEKNINDINNEAENTNESTSSVEDCQSETTIEQNEVNNVAENSETAKETNTAENVEAVEENTIFLTLLLIISCKRFIEPPTLF